MKLEAPPGAVAPCCFGWSASVLHSSWIPPSTREMIAACVSRGKTRALALPKLEAERLP